MFGKTKKNNNGEASAFLRKGDKIFVLDDGRTCFKIIRKCSQKQKDWLDVSTLSFVHDAQVFSHYFVKDLPEKRNDPEWKNLAVFFWDFTEPFPKKSLPPHFSKIKQRLFRFVKTDGIILSGGTVAPWFGQPGGGKKYYCQEKNYELTIEEMLEENIIECLEFVDIKELTSETAINREQYYFLSQTPLEFIDAWPALGGKVIPVSLAWELGLFSIVRVSV
jgi:hypothetical protein